MMSLNNIFKSSGKTEIRSENCSYDTSPKIDEKKYDITFVTTYPGNADQDQCIEGYFTGQTDNILEYYEKEYHMDEDGMFLLKNLIEINRL